VSEEGALLLTSIDVAAPVLFTLEQTLLDSGPISLPVHSTQHTGESARSLGAEDRLRLLDGAGARRDTREHPNRISTPSACLGSDHQEQWGGPQSPGGVGGTMGADGRRS
jgi:hypothetical protein